MRARGARRSYPWRRRLLLAGWLAAFGVVTLRAAEVQVVEGAAWREIARDQQRTTSAVPAPRGAVLDRDGAAMAVSRESFRVAVAPRQLRDRAAAIRALVEALGISEAEARRHTDPSDPWRPLAGRWEPAVREILGRIPGVHLERELERFRPHGDLARGVLGLVADGLGRGGVEQAFEDVLAGRAGREVLARDAEGRPVPGEILTVVPPTPGGEVRLTLDLDLQEIAHGALAAAIEREGARGGDMIVSDPQTGEILALVSMRDGRERGLSAINAPYEPGSTLKPFTVAALLQGRRATLGDSLDTGDGTWRVAGRVLHDVGTGGRMTLGDALRVSSNVGVARAAAVLSPSEQYQALRDFGFGVPTGIPLPGEVGGTLRRPAAWSAQSPASLAIGYEIAVTPLQMAMAYGALANGGRLMEPRLVREIRRPGGGVERMRPRTVRRVLDPRVARELADVLVEVVEDGSGTAARLDAFRVAGKSGTSRAYGADGYDRDRYFASFAGFFPAEDPQLVVFVKLDSPSEGRYYGGATAAPVTRATLEAVLAAGRVPLDRSALLRATRDVPPAAPARRVPPVRFASLDLSPRGDRSAAAAAASGPARPSAAAPGPTAEVPVPDVAGLPVRVAVRRLHGVGLRVRLDSDAPPGPTVPGPGARLHPGDTVRIPWSPGGSP